MRQGDVWWKGICFGCVVGALSLSLASLTGCEEAGQEGSGGEPQTSPEPSIASEQLQTPVQTPVQTPARPEAKEGEGVAYVFAGQDLGMTLTGSGAAGRSVADLEQHLATLLPQLQDLYVHELARDASLMGSIDVKLVIEPNGAVSDLRFPEIRLPGQRLKTAIFDQMRGWVFPPAAEQVHLRYRLLFVPPGVEARTILAWETRDREKRNDMRIAAAPALAEQVSSGASLETSVASAQRASASELAALPGIGKPPPIPELEGRIPGREAEAREVEPESDATWYRVLHSTVLYDAPHAYAGVVAQLRQGMRIRVVDIIEDEWLEIHSVTDRPPGYLRIQHAVPDETPQTGWS